MFGLHVILEGQLGSVLHVLLVGFEVVFGVLPPWRETNEERMMRMMRRRKSRKCEEGGTLRTFALPLDLCHRLAEVHVDAAVVDEHVVHFEVGLLTVFLLLTQKKFDLFHRSKQLFGLKKCKRKADHI